MLAQSSGFYDECSRFTLTHRESSIGQQLPRFLVLDLLGKLYSPLKASSCIKWKEHWLRSGSFIDRGNVVIMPFRG